MLVLVTYVFAVGVREMFVRHSIVGRPPWSAAGTATSASLLPTHCERTSGYDTVVEIGTCLSSELRDFLALPHVGFLFHSYHHAEQFTLECDKV